MCLNTFVMVLWFFHQDFTILAIILNWMLRAIFLNLAFNYEAVK